MLIGSAIRCAIVLINSEWESNVMGKVHLKAMAKAAVRDRFSIDSIHSPDDGGWYCECYDHKTGVEAFSTGIFATEELAIDDADKRLSELVGGLFS